MIMNTDETFEFEDRVYINPTQSRDEQLQFIDNLRTAQEQANQQIAEDTYALGTQVPTNLGGLTSGASNANSYWASRYQTPQVASQIANLQATAQADALSKILAQDQAVYQNRANQAYRAYQKRNRNNGNGGNGGNGGGDDDDIDITTTVSDDDTEVGSGVSLVTQTPYAPVNPAEINQAEIPQIPLYNFWESTNNFGIF